MRRLVVIEFVSLDGVIQSPGRADEDTSGDFTMGGWIVPYSDPVLSSIIKKQMGMPFDLLLGRTTFEIWAPYWPGHASVWPGVNTATKYVASNSLSVHEWQPNMFLSGEIVEKIKALKLQHGPDLHVYGSANLVQTLLKHDLVDSFWLKIYPITLGSGKRLFGEGTMPDAYKVVESAVTPKDVIVVNYERDSATATLNR